jgi:plasmid stabilization system protein ParE
LKLQQSEWFWADLVRHTNWYRDEAGPGIAEEFVNSVEATLKTLTRSPGLGRRRFPNRPELAGIRSFRIQKPFHRLLVFYRCDAHTFFAERLIHGARDLPRRLRQSPLEGD